MTAEVRRLGHNGLQPKLVEPFTARIESLLDDLESERSAYMLRCKSIRGDIALVFQEAADQGVPKKSFKAVIKARELEAKVERMREDLEADAQATYDQIRHALGDLEGTPLGNATLAKHPDHPQGTA